MSELKDIQNREDVVKLVDVFYENVMKDEQLGPVFAPSADHWAQHIERVYNFWDNWLFQTGSYTGGMMWVHMERHATHPMTTELFERWLAYWITCTDQLFAGKNADFVKNKALEIGQVMNAKLNAIK
ncbi:MAG: group III truncated hemoglobin [Spirosomataceae bacterium]|jgi:hemoglobin